VLREARVKKRCMAMGWIDYRKAYDMAPHSWIKEMLGIVKGDLQSVCKQSLCLHFCVQNIELYSTTIYIFKLLEYNK
jgi:hypothetical protein